MDAGTKSAIRAFQVAEGLLDDGWIGAKTETVLIQRSGIVPPGHVARPPKKPETPEEIKTSVVVRGRVPGIIQRGPTCWAAAFAMMYAWKKKHRKIEEILEEATELDERGRKWKIPYNRGQPLSEEETARLAGILGLKGVKQVPDNWAARLADHGPLMVVQNPGSEGWLHWIVVVGYYKTFVFPDRSLDREELQYKEPGNGSTLLVDLNALVKSANSLTLSQYSWFHY